MAPTADANGNLHDGSGKFTDKPNSAPSGTLAPTKEPSLRDLRASVFATVADFEEAQEGASADDELAAAIEMRDAALALAERVQEPDPQPEPRNEAERMVAKLAQLGPEKLARAITRAFATAGGQGEWDSGTIENVLGQLDGIRREAGIAAVGDSSEENHRMWAGVCNDERMYHDYDGSFEDDDDEDED